MPCPYCGSATAQEQTKRTSLGYRTFRCGACQRRCNERSGTPFNEQDHRAIEGRYRPMRGFGRFRSAARYCLAHDEVRDYFRHRTRMSEVVTLAVQREQFRVRLRELRTMLEVA